MFTNSSMPTTDLRDSAALFNFAVKYVTGQGIEKDDKKAAHYFQLAADLGHVTAQFNFAVMCEKGQGVEKDEKKAAHYYKLAADLGHVIAQFNFAVLCATGRGVEKDEKKAAHYFQLAAELGHVIAQFYFAVMCADGQGVEQDDKKAAHYYKLAADLGYDKAQFNFAVMCEKGLGVEQDDKKAAHYFQLAADLGHVIAQFNFAVRCAKGQGVKQDDKKAAHYYELAAGLGFAKAQFQFALRCEKGQGVTKDDKKATHYFKMAANQGHVSAGHKLSLKYEIGHGVKQNKEKALHFYQLATLVGEKDKIRQLIASRKSEAPFLMEAPSLLLRIFEKNRPEQSLYECIVSSNVDLNKSYIPWNPPSVKTQRGPTCGLNALEQGLTWGFPTLEIPPVRKNLIKPTQEEKVKNKNINSLRKVAKEFGSVMGEAYDIDLIQQTAKRFGFECPTIKMNEEDRVNYSEKVRQWIQAGHSVVLPIDVDDDAFPACMQGNGTHYGLPWGFIYKDNQYHFLVGQHGGNYLWSADAVQKSHEQLPDINPRCNMRYYKDHNNDSYYPLKEGQVVPECDIRFAPASDLKNFKFTALAIPTSEKNFLTLNQNKDDAPSEVLSSVKSNYGRLFAAEPILEVGVHPKLCYRRRGG